MNTENQGKRKTQYKLSCIQLYSMCNVTLTRSSSHGISVCGESFTASGEVEQLLALGVGHVTHHTPEHSTVTHERRGKRIPLIRAYLINKIAL